MLDPNRKINLHNLPTESNISQLIIKLLSNVLKSLNIVQKEQTNIKIKLMGRKANEAKYNELVLNNCEKILDDASVNLEKLGKEIFKNYEKSQEIITKIEKDIKIVDNLNTSLLILNTEKMVSGIKELKELYSSYRTNLKGEYIRR